jgi:hypothetical protein
MKTYFLSFGAGEKSHLLNLSYLCKQARSTELFDVVYDYTDYYLLNEPIHFNFSSKFKDFILNNKRGFGFWIWKSYIINYVLKNAELGDVIIYADAGCRLSDKRHLVRLIERTLFDQDLIFQLVGHNIKNYTSQTVLNKFGNYHSDKPMMAASWMSIKKSTITQLFFDRWCSLCQDTDNLIDPIKENEPNSFIDHRHDQSIFSLLIYNEFSDFLLNADKGGILNNGILIKQMRNSILTDFEFNYFKILTENSIPLNSETIQNIKLSSPPIYDSEIILKDLTEIKFKSDYSFHSSLEINPNITFYFKNLTKIKFIVIENRRFHEARISKLCISTSIDNIQYSLIYQIDQFFGGLYDDSPLVISLNGSLLKSIRFTNQDINPVYFHLKSIYLY